MRNAIDNGCSHRLTSGVTVNTQTNYVACAATLSTAMMTLAVLTGCSSPGPRNPALVKPDGARFLASFRVCARPHWNNTSVDLVKGHRYYFELPGNPVWYDWFVRSGPEGYNSPFLFIFTPLRRYISAPWFCLIGSLDKRRRDRFVIGNGAREYSATASGRLFCYANDVLWMYWNNHGEIQVNVYELPQPSSGVGDSSPSRVRSH